MAANIDEQQIDISRERVHPVKFFLVFLVTSRSKFLGGEFKLRLPILMNSRSIFLGEGASSEIFPRVFGE